MSIKTISEDTRLSLAYLTSFPFFSLLFFSYLEDEYHARKNGDNKDRDKVPRDEKSAGKESSEGTESFENSQKDRCDDSNVHADTEASSEEKESCAERSLMLNLPVPLSPVIAAGGAGVEEEKDKDKKKRTSALTSIKASTISMPHFKCNVRALLLCFVEAHDSTYISFFTVAHLCYWFAYVFPNTYCVYSPDSCDLFS